MYDRLFAISLAKVLFPQEECPSIAIIIFFTPTLYYFLIDKFT